MRLLAHSTVYMHVVQLQLQYDTEAAARRRCAKLSAKKRLARLFTPTPRLQETPGEGENYVIVRSGPSRSPRPNSLMMS
jgi:hypothetical protein